MKNAEEIREELVRIGKTGDIENSDELEDFEVWGALRALKWVLGEDPEAPSTWYRREKKQT